MKSSLHRSVSHFSIVLQALFSKRPALDSTTFYGSSCEIEELENRVLLSGISSGVVSGKQYHKVTFEDASGDKVMVSLIDNKTHKVSNAATFTIGLNGGVLNHEDINTITLSKGITDGVSLSIKALPVKLSSSTYSSGVVSVNSIEAGSSILKLGAINLSAAIVNDIHLPNVDIGSISLNTGQAQYADRINTVTNTPITNYQPTAGAIDLGDVEAASIGAIVIKGVQAQNNRQLDFTNDLTGNINVSGRIGSITDLFGGLSGSITADTVGLVNVNSLGGSVTVTNVMNPPAGTTDPLTGVTDYTYANTTSVQTGTMLGSLTIAGNVSLQVSSGYEGNVTAMGHVYFGVNAGLTNGSIYGAGGISGLGSETAPINLPGTSNTSFATSGQSENYQQPPSNPPIPPPIGSEFPTTTYNLGATIAAINVNGGIGEDFTIKSAGDVGNITAQTFTDNGPTITALGKIGNLTATSTGGVINGTFDAGKGIGNLTATAEVDGTYTARGSSNIGSITAGWGIGVNDDMTVSANTIGNITSYFGDIYGNYTSYSTELAPTWVPATSSSPAHFDTGLAIGNITAGTGTVYGIFDADGNIGSIDANGISGSFTSASGDIGYVQDPNHLTEMIPGNIIASRRNGNAIDGATFSAGNSIGNIYATLTNPNGGVNGIANSTFVAGTYGSTDPSITPSIGNISVNNAGYGSGIYQSVFGVDNVNGQVSNANIGTISVNCPNQNPEIGSAAIKASVFNGSTQTQLYYNPSTHAFMDSAYYNTALAHNTDFAYYNSTTGQDVGGEYYNPIIGINTNSSYYCTLTTTQTDFAYYDKQTGIYTNSSIDSATGLENFANTANSLNVENIPNTATGIYNNEGTIGNITVTANQNYYGILGSTFGAGQSGSIGDLNVQSGLFAIALSNIHANQPALGYAGSGSDFSGHIGEINVKSTSTNNGQVSSYIPTPVPTPANWIAGPILFPSTAGSNGGGIYGSLISASGCIGDISTQSIGYGIVSTSITANDGSHNTTPGTGSLGKITVNVTGAGASGITEGMYVTGLLGSGPLGNIPGPLTDVFGAVIDRNTGLFQGAIINGPDFINLPPNLTVIPSSFSGTSIGDVTVNLSSMNGDSAAISHSQFTATCLQSGNDTGTIGNITVSNSSPSARAHGIYGGSFNAGAAGSIGNVAVTEAGGDAISTYNGFNNNLIPSVFSATGLAENSSGTPVQNQFTSTIGTVTISENSTVESSFLGSGPGEGITAGIFQAMATIGNITSSGVGEQHLVLGDNRVGVLHHLGVGNLDFSLISIGNTLTATFTSDLTGSANQVGDITTGLGGMVITNGLSLNTVGNISVGSFLHSPDAAPLLPVAVGSGSAGSSIGLISVGVGTPADSSNYLFSFTQMNGVGSPGSSVLAVHFLDGTSDISTAQAASGINNVSGGIKAVLI